MRAAEHARRRARRGRVQRGLEDALGLDALLVEAELDDAQARVVVVAALAARHGDLQRPLRATRDRGLGLTREHLLVVERRDEVAELDAVRLRRGAGVDDGDAAGAVEREAQGAGLVDLEVRLHLLARLEAREAPEDVDGAVAHGGDVLHGTSTSATAARSTGSSRRRRARRDPTGRDPTGCGQPEPERPKVH